MGGISLMGYLNHSLILLVLSFFVVMFARKIETRLIRLYGYGVGAVLLVVALLSAGIILMKMGAKSNTATRNSSMMQMPMQMPMPPR